MPCFNKPLSVVYCSSSAIFLLLNLYLLNAEFVDWLKGDPLPSKIRIFFCTCLKNRRLLIREQPVGVLFFHYSVSLATIKESNNPLRVDCYIQAEPIFVGAELRIMLLFSQGKALWLIKLVTGLQLL
jgi:hypothetical protein